MQMIHLPVWLTIISFFAFWLIYQSLVALVTEHIPLSAFDYRKGIFKTRNWEKHYFYSRYFGIKKWKRFLPDGSDVSTKIFPKRHLASTHPAYLERFLAESCRAELSHWICFLPFWIFGFWAPPFVIPIMFVYALAMNMPCIIAQRYNRPRLAAFLELVNKGNGCKLLP